MEEAQEEKQLFTKALEATLIEPVRPGSLGRIRCHGVFYRAELYSSQIDSLPAGSRVYMVGIKNNIALVKPEPSFRASSLIAQLNDSNLILGISLPDYVASDEIALEIAKLCRALNAYHIACGGNGLTIDDEETLACEIALVMV